VAAPKFMRCLRDMEGKVQITWDGTTANDIRIVRRKLDYPVDINDGVVIFTGPTSSLSDANALLDDPADPDNIFYYRFFEEISPGVWTTAQRLTDHDWEVVFKE